MAEQSSKLPQLFSNPADHKALVTGGSRGIGAAFVQTLRNAGVTVVAPTRSELNLQSQESIQQFIQKHQGDGFDILINNAGINIINPMEKTQSADWQAMVQTNLTAPFQLIQGFAPYMKSKKWGRILNISSIFSFITKESRAAYSSTKAGLNGLTRTAAVELAPYSVLVNALCPGYVDTDLTRQNNSPSDIQKICEAIPAKRMAAVEELANTALFLCSELNTYMTGQSIVVDGGFSLR